MGHCYVHFAFVFTLTFNKIYSAHSYMVSDWLIRRLRIIMYLEVLTKLVVVARIETCGRRKLSSTGNSDQLLTTPHPTHQPPQLTGVRRADSAQLLHHLVH